MSRRKRMDQCEDITTSDENVAANTCEDSEVSAYCEIDDESAVVEAVVEEASDAESDISIICEKQKEEKAPDHYILVHEAGEDIDLNENDVSFYPVSPGSNDEVMMVQKKPGKGNEKTSSTAVANAKKKLKKDDQVSNANAPISNECEPLCTASTTGNSNTAETTADVQHNEPQRHESQRCQPQRREPQRCEHRLGQVVQILGIPMVHITNSNMFVELSRPRNAPPVSSACPHTPQQSSTVSCSASQPSSTASCSEPRPSSTESCHSPEPSSTVTCHSPQPSSEVSCRSPVSCSPQPDSAICSTIPQASSSQSKDIHPNKNRKINKRTLQRKKERLEAVRLRAVKDMPNGDIDSSAFRDINHDTDRFICTGNGVVFEDYSIKVYAQTEVGSDLYRVFLFFKNKTTNRIHSLMFNASEDSIEKLRFKFSAVCPSIPADHEVRQYISVRCVDDFNERPSLLLVYMFGSNGEAQVLRNVRIRLPVFINKFFDPTFMNSEEFWAKWNRFNVPSQEVVKIFKAKKPMDREATKRKLRSFGVGLCQVISENPETFFGASGFNLITFTIDCLIQLEPNRQTEVYTLTVRTGRGSVSKEICKLLEKLF